MFVGILGFIGLNSGVYAANPVETVELGADFEISKCSWSGNSNTCDSAASMPSNIANPS